jgi:hypothetical protein
MIGYKWVGFRGEQSERLVLVVAAATGKVALIVLACIVAAILLVLRWNNINRRRGR